MKSTHPQSSIPNPQSAIRNRRSGIRGLQSPIPNPQSAIPNPQSAIPNPQSAIRNPQSAIRNPQSAIRNPQSAIRNPQSAIRSGTPRAAILLAACFTLAGCGFLQGGPRSPFGPITPPAATAQDLAAKLNSRLGRCNNLSARMDTLASFQYRLGKRRNTILLRYKSPNCVLLGLAAEPFGIVLRVKQNGKEIALLDQHDVNNQVFYSGTLEDLASRPGFLFGLRPLDVVRPLLASYDLVDILKKEKWDLPAPSFWRRTWKLETADTAGRRTVYKVGLADGLIREINVYDAAGRSQARAIYGAYANFDGGLFPSRFELIFSESGLQLRAQVQDVKLYQEPNDEMFSLTPPPNMEVRSLREWLERKQD